MRTMILAALAATALTAPAAMADVTNSEARQIVKDLIARDPAYGARIGDVQRQGAYIIVHTLTSDGLIFRTLKVDPENGQLVGLPAGTMTGKRDTSPNG